MVTFYHSSALFLPISPGRDPFGGPAVYTFDGWILMPRSAAWEGPSTRGGCGLKWLCNSSSNSPLSNTDTAGASRGVMPYYQATLISTFSRTGTQQQKRVFQDGVLLMLR